MKTHRTYSLNKKKLKNWLQNGLAILGVSGFLLGVGGTVIWAVITKEKLREDEAAERELMHQTLSKNFNGNSFQIIGSDSVLYEQSTESEVSFHFDSNTIIVKHESAEEAARIYNFSEFEAQGLIEESREAGCKIALNFLDNEEEYEEKLTEDRFEELSKRLGPFAKDYCEASTSGELQSEPTSPSLS